jgi:hypothetical protein
MKRTIFRILLLSLGVAFAVGAQQKAQPKENGNIQGTVRTITRDQSRILVHTSQGADRTVIYSADTKWGVGTSKKNTPASLDKLKEGYFLNCGGTFQGLELAATSCYFRETK